MLYTIAANILEVAHCAVVECTVGLPCPLPEIVGYVSVGVRIEDPVPDRLVVSLANLGASPQSSDNAGRMNIPMWRATYQVQLLESGWPTPQGDMEEIVVPTAEEYASAAMHAYAHGEKMYRALVVALHQNELNPYQNDGTFKRIADLAPMEPSGGTVGWETTVTVDCPLNASKQTV
jgi:hypothetical protein